MDLLHSWSAHSFHVHHHLQALALICTEGKSPGPDPSKHLYTLCGTHDSSSQAPSLHAALLWYSSTLHTVNHLLLWLWTHQEGDCIPPPGAGLSWIQLLSGQELGQVKEMRCCSSVKKLQNLGHLHGTWLRERYKRGEAWACPRKNGLMGKGFVGFVIWVFCSQS